MPGSVFCFVPNIIGYCRVALLVLSLVFMQYHPGAAATLYLSSAFLDEFDGMAARRLKQCSLFGAVLDIVTDRCTTTCLIMTLCLFYPRWVFLFQLAVINDISSHWIFMHSTMLQSPTQSHKVTANPVLKIYYCEPVLSLFCYGNELFFAALYLTHFTSGPVVSFLGYQCGMFEVLAVICFPITLVRQCVCLCHLIIGSMNIVAVDEAQRSK